MAKEKNNFNETINLPKTDFPMRAGLPKREPDMLKRWDEQDIYHVALKKSEGKPASICTTALRSPTAIFTWVTP